MRFKSIENSLKENGYKIISSCEKKEQILKESAKLMIDLAKGKYSNLAILPFEILTEGSEIQDKNSTAFYVLPSSKENEPNILSINSYLFDQNKEKYYLNEDNFKAEIQTKHPYQSWHDELKNRGYETFSVSTKESLPKNLGELIVTSAKDSDGKFIILPQEIALKGLFTPKDKDLTIAYTKFKDKEEKMIRHISLRGYNHLVEENQFFRL